MWFVHGQSYVPRRAGHAHQRKLFSIVEFGVSNKSYRPNSQHSVAPCTCGIGAAVTTHVSMQGTCDTWHLGPSEGKSDHLQQPSI